MNVMGHKVPQAVFDALRSRLHERPAQAFVLVGVAADMGMPTRGYVAHRVVDRWLQRERKAGRIRFVNRRWQLSSPEQRSDTHG